MASNASPIPPLSPLCFGTMTFGREADKANAKRLFNQCRDAGIHFFDCADIYAGGESERILGELIRDCRDEVMITSKVGMKDGLAPETIRQAIDASLQRLGTDHVEIYFCHRFDDDVPVQDTLAAMSALVDAGKVGAIGVSNWAAWQVARALGTCELHDWNPIRFIQPMYNLAKRTAEIELLPLAEAESLGVISYNPLGGGLLTGKYHLKDGGGGDDARLNRQENYAKRYGDTLYHDIARRFVAFARERGFHPVTLAIAWVMHNPAVTAPILGARNPEQLAPALDALQFEMTPELYQEICALTPPVPPATDRTEED